MPHICISHGEATGTTRSHANIKGKIDTCLYLTVNSGCSSGLLCNKECHIVGQCYLPFFLCHFMQGQAGSIKVDFWYIFLILSCFWLLDIDLCSTVGHPSQSDSINFDVTNHFSDPAWPPPLWPDIRNSSPVTPLCKFMANLHTVVTGQVSPNIVVSGKISDSAKT